MRLLTPTTGGGITMVFSYDDPDKPVWPKGHRPLSVAQYEKDRNDGNGGLYAGGFMHEFYGDICDVRIATDEVVKKTLELNAAIKKLQDEKDELFRSSYIHAKPVTHDMAKRWTD